MQASKTFNKFTGDPVDHTLKKIDIHSAKTCFWRTEVDEQDPKL